MKTSEAPFDDIDVRRAVFQAIDPWGAVADVWSEAAFVSLGLPAVRSDWLLGDDEMRRYFGDPDLALDLLRSAGVDRPVPFTIKVGSFGQAYLDHADRVARRTSCLYTDLIESKANHRSSEAAQLPRHPRH